MILSNVFDGNKIYLSTVVNNDYVLTTVNGTEVYSLSDKSTGRVTLAAFESKIAANRFFAENKSYNATKII